MAKMGLQFGLEGNSVCYKRQFRWMFEIPDVCGDTTPEVNALPPEKSARPSCSFNEMKINHMIEDVYFPAKPDWKPINITLFDISKRSNPVFDWLKEIYEPEKGAFYPPNKNSFIKECYLRMYDGCGEIIENWIYEDCWAQSINFNTLDMTTSSICYAEVSLRYARAYIN